MRASLLPFGPDNLFFELTHNTDVRRPQGPVKDEAVRSTGGEADP